MSGWDPPDADPHAIEGALEAAWRCVGSREKLGPILRDLVAKVRAPLIAHIQMHVEGSKQDQLRAVVVQRDEIKAKLAEREAEGHAAEERRAALEAELSVADGARRPTPTPAPSPCPAPNLVEATRVWAVRSSAWWVQVNAATVDEAIDRARAVAGPGEINDVTAQTFQINDVMRFE